MPSKLPLQNASEPLQWHAHFRGPKLEPSVWDATLKVSFPLSVPNAELENCLEVVASVQ